MPDFVELSSSSQFTFLLGPDKVPIMVHGNVFKAISEPLHALMNNGMKETKDRSASLEEIAPTAFVMLVEYAYSDKVMRMRRLVGPSSPTKSTDANVWTLRSDDLRHRRCMDPYCSYRGSTEQHVECSLKRSLDRFALQSYEPDSDEVPNWLLIDGTREPSTYSQVDLLAYSQLYVLATQYLVADLPELCLIVVSRALNDWSPDEVENFVEALLYTFENSIPDSKDPFYRLRELFLYHATSKTKELLTSQKFQDVVEQNGQIGLSMLKMTHLRSDVF